MDRVIVGGGTGFVGYWMQQTQPKDLECHYIGSKDTWDGSLQYKYFVHLAPISPAPACEYVKRNHMTRLLYCSSGIVYHPENNTEYRQNKVKWEQECLASGVDVVIARLFTFFGEHLDDNKAYTRFSEAARQNSDIEIWGDGSTVRSYMHGSELGKWMWAILLKGKSGEAYDVGSDIPITMLELAKMIKDNSNSTSKITFRNQREPMPFYLPKNTEKTRALL